MAPEDGITTCHRYCTAYVVSNGKPVTVVEFDSHSLCGCTRSVGFNLWVSLE